MVKLKNIFSNVINVNHWFTYGKAWLLLPYTIIGISSQMAIFLLFFNMEGNTTLLLSLTLISIVGSLVLGVILFFKKGQQADITMSQWRNPIPHIGYLGNFYIVTNLAIKYKFDIPEHLKEYGITEWEDLYYVWRYILNKGSDAKAKELCKTFFKDVKKNE